MGGEGGQRVGRERGWAIPDCPMFSESQGRPGIQVAKGPGLLPDTLGSDSSSVTLGR